MLRGHHPVGGQQREGAAAVALAEHQAQGGSVEGDQVGEAPGDLAGEATVLRVRRQRGPLGVDHGHQRQPQLAGQPHAAARLAQRLGAERVVGGLAPPVLAQEHAGCLPEPHQCDQQPGVGLALAGAVERYDVGGGVPQQASYAGPVGAPGPGDGVPGVDVRDLVVPGLRHRVDAEPRRVQDGERAVQDVRDLVGCDDGVDDAVGVEVLGRLHAVGEGPSVERLVDPRAEEPHQGARLGDGHVAEGAPGGHHPAGRGVAQVDQVGESGGLVRRDRLADPHHLHEGRRPLLHPGAAADRGSEQREALAGGALDRRHQPVGGVAPDRAGQEAELPGDHGHAATSQPPLAGDDRLVDAAALGRSDQLGGVRLGERSGASGRHVPAVPGPVVEHQVDERVGGEPVGHARRLLAARVRAPVVEVRVPMPGRAGPPTGSPGKRPTVAP